MERILDQNFSQTITHLLESRCDQTPESNCFHFRAIHPNEDWTSITWGQFRGQVLRIALALKEAGVKSGDRVALLHIGPLSEAYAHAVYRLRGAVVSIDLGSNLNELTRLFRENLVSTVLADGPGWTNISRSGSRFTATKVILDRLPGEPLPSGYICLNSLLQQASATESATERLSNPLPEDLAMVVYTSGTTGTSKGIPYRHEQIMAACRALVGTYPELGPNDRTICWLPLSAMFQRMANLLSMACGMETFFVSDPRAIFDVISEVQPSFFIGVPRFYEKLDEALAKREPAKLAESLKRIKLMISGSAPIPLSVLHSLDSHGIPVREAYGLSENAIPVAVNKLSNYRYGSVGRPLAPNEVKLADDGEVLVKGPGVFNGYVDGTSDREQFNPDGFYRTGDLGAFDEDGFLWLNGRKRDLIKTSTGRRIAPTKIEAVYGACRQINQIVVIGDGRKYLGALITLSRVGGDLSPESHSGLQQELLTAGESLNSHERIQVFGVLPRPFGPDEVTSSQKLRRAVILRRYATFIDHLYAQPTPCIVLAENLRDRPIDDPLA